jgi:hypothetical protein
MARQKTFPPETVRVFKLARKICDLFTEDELRRISPVDPYTIQRWAEEKHGPRGNNDLAMAQIIAVKESSIQAYLDGDIDLETLWSRRNEAPRVNVAESTNFDDIVVIVKNLCSTDRFRLAMIALESIKPGEINPDSNPKIQLGARSKTRLKALLNTSMTHQRQTPKTLITAGVDPSLVHDLVDKFEKDYSEQTYQTLLPYLSKPTLWVDDDLVQVSLTETITSLEELWTEIEWTPPG